jgi:hypothetical protein
MFGDIVMIVLALAAVGWLLSYLGGGERVGSPARPTPTEPPQPAPAGSAGEAGGTPSGGVPTGPAASGDPAHDPWRDADGAFVDGYVIGRYVERSRHAEDAGRPAPDEPTAGGDDPASGHDDLGGDHADPSGSGQHGFSPDSSATGAPDGAEFEDGSGSDWFGGFGEGSGDGFDDGFDDDW